MNEKDKFFILKIFADYYSKAIFDIFNIEQREFGIGLLKKIDARHLAFDSTDVFRKYLLNNTPLFVSHSISYYNHPAATPIEKKLRNGADLVFDLDLHAEEKYGVYYKLDTVKKDTARLIEDFLIADFGIAKKDILIVFSGNRGYHVHVRDRHFFDLGSDERKEIVDYVTGTGLNYQNFFVKEELSKTLAILYGPTPYEQGYRGRFARNVIETIENKPTKLSRKLSDSKERNNIISGIKEGNWGKTSIKDVISMVKSVADELPLYTVNTDAGVTQDLSKLIRVPNSIHGETGLIAKIVDNLDTFNPLSDAIIDNVRNPSGDYIQNNKTKSVVFLEDVPELEFANQTLGAFKKDEKKELQLSAAMFFVLKGSASFAF